MAAGMMMLGLGATIGPLMSGLSKAGAGIGGFASKAMSSLGPLKLIGGIAAAGMAAAVAVTMKAVGAAVEFEKQMAYVSTMVDDTDKHMGDFSRSLLQMSVDYGEGTETLSKGLYDILSASIPAAEAIEFLGVAVRAAKGGMTDTGVAADALTSVINSYKLGAEDATRISDIMFATVKAGKLEFPELASSIGQVASIASVAGVSFEEVSGAISTMTRNGLSCANSVTSLGAMILNFMTPQENAIKAAAEHGIALNTTTLKIEGLLGVMQKCAKLAPEQVAKIFPQRVAVKGAAIMSQAAKEFGADIEKAYNSAGKAAEAADKMMGTTAFTIDQAKAGLKKMLVEAAQPFLPFVKELIEGVKNLIKDAKPMLDVIIPMTIGALKVIIFLVGTLLEIVGVLLSPLKVLLEYVGLIAGETKDLNKELIETMETMDGIDNAHRLAYQSGKLFYQMVREGSKDIPRDTLEDYKNTLKNLRKEYDELKKAGDKQAEGEKGWTKIAKDAAGAVVGVLGIEGRKMHAKREAAKLDKMRKEEKKSLITVMIHEVATVKKAVEAKGIAHKEEMAMYDKIRKKYGTNEEEHKRISGIILTSRTKALDESIKAILKESREGKISFDEARKRLKDIDANFNESYKFRDKLLESRKAITEESIRAEVRAIEERGKKAKDGGIQEEKEYREFAEKVRRMQKEEEEWYAKHYVGKKDADKDYAKFHNTLADDILAKEEARAERRRKKDMSEAEKLREYLKAMGKLSLADEEKRLHKELAMASGNIDLIRKKEIALHNFYKERDEERKNAIKETRDMERIRIDHEVRMGRMGIEKQISAYNHLLKAHKWTAEERMRLEETLHDMQKRNLDETERRLERWISFQKNMGQMNAKEEMNWLKKRLAMAGDDIEKKMTLLEKIHALEERQRRNQYNDEKEVIERLNVDEAEKIYRKIKLANKWMAKCKEGSEKQKKYEKEVYKLTLALNKKKEEWFKKTHSKWLKLTDERIAKIKEELKWVLKGSAEEKNLKVRAAWENRNRVMEMFRIFKKYDGDVSRMSEERANAGLEYLKRMSVAEGTSMEERANILGKIHKWEKGMKKAGFAVAEEDAKKQVKVEESKYEMMKRKIGEVDDAMKGFFGGVEKKAPAAAEVMKNSFIGALEAIQRKFAEVFGGFAGIKGLAPLLAIPAGNVYADVSPADFLKGQNGKGGKVGGTEVRVERGAIQVGQIDNELMKKKTADDMAQQIANKMGAVFVGAQPW